MLTRRSILASAAALSLPAIALAQAKPDALAPAKLGEDGLYHLDWYLESFLDLADDLAATTKSGKRLAIMWGLKGCPACKIMHEVHLADPAITAYIRANFEVLHLNHIGSRDVTDFDGQKLREKALGEAYGIRFTPTIQFLPESIGTMLGKQGQAREVARMPGLLEPKLFLAMFRFVAEKGYESSTFPDWAKRQGV
jgi:thioredoxin-related protein